MEPCYRIKPDGSRELITPVPQVTCVQCNYISRSSRVKCPKCGGTMVNYDGEVGE